MASSKTQKTRRAEKAKQRRAFRVQVLARAAGYCDRCLEYAGADLQAHHYRPRSLGGSDDPRMPMHLSATCSNDPSQCHEDGNGLAMCPQCHYRTHQRHLGYADWINSRNKSLPDA